LKRVISGEKIKMEDSTLLLIASYSDGSFRDATKILEQLISENIFDEKEIKNILGKNNGDIYSFLEMINGADIHNLLVFVKDLIGKGSDIKFFISEILDTLHKILLAKNSINSKDVPDKWKNLFDIGQILGLIKLFSKVYTEIRYANRPELPLEVAIVEWCNGKNKL
jgi:DNA polymerase III gamma/tau subunit